VLCLLGRGRSGSTILARALGGLAGFFSAGELRTLWDPVLPARSACACGAPVPDCPVWSQVLARLDRVDRLRAASWQREVVSEARLPRLLRRPGGHRWPALPAYRQVMGQVYAAIADVTGARTVVDSSKRPSYGLVLRDLPGVEAFFVHLVRDPRACAYSWRTRRHTGAAGTAVRQVGAVDATLRWDLLNLGAEAVLLAAGGRHGLRLRYEDFAAAPRRTVQRVTELVGGPPAGTAFLDERTLPEAHSHELAGNPVRHRAGPVRIRPDGEWTTAQRPVDRLLASAVAFPLLRRYGYPLRPDSSA
jgi:hypothetical protein